MMISVISITRYQRKFGAPIGANLTTIFGVAGLVVTTLWQCLYGRPDWSLSISGDGSELPD